jgi:Ca2+-binding RTX toxin-like protein
MVVYYGTNAADVFTGTSADDEFFCYAGNDMVYSSGGNDTVWGSTGQDTLNYSLASSVRLDLERGSNFAPMDGFGSYDFIFDVEHVIGSTFSDRAA